MVAIRRLGLRELLLIVNDLRLKRLGLRRNRCEVGIAQRQLRLECGQRLADLSFLAE